MVVSQLDELILGNAFADQIEIMFWYKGKIGLILTDISIA